MAKKCSHKGRIERRQSSGKMMCHKVKRKVNIAVMDHGNYCTDSYCPHSQCYIPSTSS